MLFALLLFIVNIHYMFTPSWPSSRVWLVLQNWVLQGNCYGCWYWAGAVCVCVFSFTVLLMQSASHAELNTSKTATHRNKRKIGPTWAEDISQKKDGKGKWAAQGEIEYFLYVLLLVVFLLPSNISAAWPIPVCIHNSPRSSDILIYLYINQT